MILVINGSPNKNSKTLSVTNEIIKGSDEEIKYINAYDITADSCDDCKYCHTKKGCVKRDDMDFIYELLYSANTLIISSPVYFGGMSDQTMKIINRFQRFFEHSGATTRALFFPYNFLWPSLVLQLYSCVCLPAKQRILLKDFQNA